MQITFKAKQAGKKHALIENKIIEIDEIGEFATLATLLKAIVKQQVTEYNNKTAEKNLLPFLAKDEIAGQAETGKVGFGAIYNENKANLITAQETALQAFEDGMFAVFADDDEIQKLDEIVNLNKTNVFTFIRLTFLAGSYF
jgi:ATP-dependent exoDNAse (exonuclease V) alpha subunit